MNEDLYAKALNIKITELIKKGGGYYRFDRSNFREFFDNITDEQKDIMADLYSENKVYTVFGYLDFRAAEYWERLARSEAEARLAEDCPQCWGLGCPACEDNENEGE